MKTTFTPILTIVVLTAGCYSSRHPSSGSASLFNLTGNTDGNGYKVNPMWSGQTAAGCLETEICNKPLPVDPVCSTSVNSIDVVPRSIGLGFIQIFGQRQHAFLPEAD
jgi:hypothetical protein